MEDSLLKKVKERHKYPITTLLCEVLDGRDIDSLAAAIEVPGDTTLDDEIDAWVLHGEGNLDVLQELLQLIDVPEILGEAALRLTAIARGLDDPEEKL